jgi:hypothetical protein
MKRSILVLFLSLVACSAASSAGEPGPPHIDAGHAAPDVDAANGTDAGEPDSSEVPVNCEGERYRPFCYGNASPETRWGFDARCTAPYKTLSDGGIEPRAQGLYRCHPAHLLDGFQVLCCDDSAEAGAP